MKKTFLYGLLFLSITFSFIPVYGQLSGAYTINASAAASGSNYTSFTAAVFDLASASGVRPDGGPRNGPGVSAAVVINVSNGTYFEHVVLNPVSGTSISNTVTFRGQDSMQTKLTFDSAHAVYTLKVAGA